MPVEQNKATAYCWAENQAKAAANDVHGN